MRSRSEDPGKTRESSTEWASGEHRPVEAHSRKAAPFGGLGVEGTPYSFPTMEGAALSGGNPAAVTMPSPDSAAAKAEIGALEQRVLGLQRQEQRENEALEAARAQLPPRPEDDEDAKPAYLSAVDAFDRLVLAAHMSGVELDAARAGVASALAASATAARLSALRARASASLGWEGGAVSTPLPARRSGPPGFGDDPVAAMSPSLRVAMGTSSNAERVDINGAGWGPYRADPRTDQRHLESHAVNLSLLGEAKRILARASQLYPGILFEAIASRECFTVLDPIPGELCRQELKGKD